MKNNSETPSLNKILDEILLLDYDSLRKLNGKIVARIKKLQNLKASVELMQFEVLDKVSFMDNGSEVVGVITRINRKTVRVMSEEDSELYWLVSPSLLKKVSSKNETIKSFIKIES